MFLDSCEDTIVDNINVIHECVRYDALSQAYASQEVKDPYGGPYPVV